MDSVKKEILKLKVRVWNINSVCCYQAVKISVHINPLSRHVNIIEAAICQGSGNTV